MDFSNTNLSANMSLSGSWIPVTTDGDSGQLIYNEGTKYSRVILPNGTIGLVASASAFHEDGTYRPVNVAIYEQNAVGSLTLATSKYIADPVTAGTQNIIVSDLNGDGLQDILLTAFNETSFEALGSTLYIANENGIYTKIEVGDHTIAHNASLVDFNDTKSVFVANFIDPLANPYQNITRYTFNADNTVNVDVTSQIISGTTVDLQTSGSNALNPMSVTAADFNKDGKLDLLLGDFRSWSESAYSDTAKLQLGVFQYDENTNNISSTPVLLDPYFNSRPQYSNLSSAWGLANTHTYQSWTEDFNQDGKIDILAAQTLWPSPYSMLQMWQNTSPDGGIISFADKTDTLNNSWNFHAIDVDDSMQRIDIDHSGINTYLLAGNIPFSDQDDSDHSNYILLNDGTGQLHVYMHDEFAQIADQVNQYINTAHPDGNPGHWSNGRFYETVTADGQISLAMEAYFQKVVNGENVQVTQLINTGILLNPTIDFADNITISDRNGSSNIRTWAGNDIISDNNIALTSVSNINTGNGSDTVTYSDTTDPYYLTFNDRHHSISVTHNDHTDVLNNVEQILFTNGSITQTIRNDGSALATIREDSHVTVIDTSSKLPTVLNGTHLYINPSYIVQYADQSELNTISAVGNTFNGQELDDLIIGTGQADAINAGNGNNIINSGASNDAITSGSGIDFITSGAGNDRVNSGAGNDVLRTNTGADIINAGAGNDWIVGGAGSDTITGGTGNDVFIFNISDRSIDRILDFNATEDILAFRNEDVLAFSDVAFSKLANGINADNFVIGTEALDVNDLIIFNSSTGALFIDADGSGNGEAVQIATIQGNLDGFDYGHCVNVGILSFTDITQMGLATDNHTDWFM